MTAIACRPIILADRQADAENLAQFGLPLLRALESLKQSGETL